MRIKGFTLIEVMIAITILAIVGTIGLTTYSNAQIVSRDARRRQDLKTVQTALEGYAQTQKPRSYPVRTTYSGPNSLATDLNPPTFINQIPNDPTNSSPYIYKYTGSATSYSLCSQLENKNTPLGSGVETCNTSCGGSSTNMCLHFTNP